MRVILASPRGFCAGVNMAVSTLDMAIERFGTPVYVYHEIVHNRRVVQTFRERGAVFVSDLDDVPPGSIVLFSAHGVSPQVRRRARARNLTAIDAACPLVAKVHRQAIHYAKAGYTIVFIGHERHDEVVATLAEAPESMVLVETCEDVDRLDISPDEKLVYLTQTTLSLDDTRRIVQRLQARFPQIEHPPSENICFATQNRQRAVSLLSEEADIVLVLGSQNSSNSRRLHEIVLERGIESHLIDGAAELDATWFRSDSTVLITAGASAPEATVQECVSLLQQCCGATVEERSIVEERVTFALPRELQATASHA